ncbi:hypothetical protein G7062_02300 [Erysipelothrix sp. HDW6C]|uniref:hypothetical protein n=1 Tax=Erysipelothrix sp. HDW6C TaxID=2714930 RepID=UPI001407E2F1|nr:hypothetical protein [Erysipelothrix sp. HDW6C]QIK69188.1 hypothetical protein G7062_02300 [Erysipelothrix sp. HDW6C]
MFKKFSSRCTKLSMALLLIFSSFTAYSVSAEEKDEYSNDDINIVVDKYYNQETNDVEIIVSLKEKEENIEINDILFPGQDTVEDLTEGSKVNPDNDDHKYTYTVNENGYYEFKIDYTIKIEVPVEKEEEIVPEPVNSDEVTVENDEALEEPQLAEETDAETKIVERDETYKFTVKVDAITDVESIDEPEFKEPSEPETPIEEPIEEEKPVIGNFAGQSGLTISTSLTSPANLDIQNRTVLDVSFTVGLNTATVIYNPKLIIDLTGVNLLIDTQSFSKPNGSKSAVYDSKNNRIIVEYNEPFSGTSTFNFKAKPYMDAVNGEQFKINASWTGFSDLANTKPYEDAKVATANITTVGTEHGTINADPTNIATWNQTATPWRFSQVASTTVYNRYYLSSKAGTEFPELYFKNLVIVKDITEENWSTSKSMYVEADKGLTDYNRGVITETTSNSIRMEFGERTLSQLYVREDSSVPSSAQKKTYNTEYHVYNGSEYLYSFKKEIGVLHDTSMYVYPVLSKENVGMNESFSYTITPQIKSGPNPMKDMEIIIPINSKLKPMMMSAGPASFFSTFEYYYEVNNSGTFIRQTGSSFADLSSIANITSLKIKQRLPSATSNDYASLLIVFKNIGLGTDEKADIAPSKITFVNTEGNTVDYLAKNTVKNTVTGINTNTISGPSKITASVYNGVNASSGQIPTTPVTNVNFSQQLRLGNLLGGNLDNAYMYAIVPKEINVQAVASETIRGYRIKPGASINDEQLTQMSMTYQYLQLEKISLDESRDLYLIKTNEPLKSDTLRNFDFLNARLGFTSSTLAAGKHKIEFGFGSLSSDLLEGQTLMTDIVESTLDAKVKSAIGSSNSKVFKLDKEIEIVRNDDVQGLSWSKGGLDSDWILTGSGISTSMVNSTIDYKYEITNTSTTTFDTYDLIDILPHKNDEYIINSGSRGSQYVVNLGNTPIKAMINGVESAVLVQYATTYNPDRFDKNGNAVTGDGRWSTQAPANRADIKSIKISLVGTKFKPGDKLTLEFQGVLPLGTPRNDELANNTVALMGKYSNGGSTLSKTYEMPVTSVKATKPENNGELSGSVYIDQNGNGKKDGVDAGLNQLTVELFKNSDLGTAVASTTTTTSGAGVTGTFGFSNLPYNEDTNANDYYKIRVTLPENGSGVTAGDNKVINDATNPTKYVWLTIGGKDSFKLSDVPAVGSIAIENIDGAIKVVTPITGSVKFVDKAGVDVASDYGKNYSIEIYDGATKLGTATSGNAGVFTLSNVVLTTANEYTLKFTNNTGKAFVFAPKNTEPNDGTLRVTMEPGIKSENNVIYITDNQAPTITNLLVNAGQNPTDITYTTGDLVTAVVSQAWEITGPAGSTKKTGTAQNTIAAALTELKTAGVTGSYTFKLTIKDAAGNEATDSRTFNILGAGATDKPTINTSKPTSTTINVKKTATNPTGAQVITTFGITAKDALNNPITDISKFTFADLDKVDFTTIGTYTVKVTVQDTVENISEPATQVTYVVNDTEVPTLSIPNKTIQINSSKADPKTLTLDQMEKDLNLFGTVVRSDNDKASEVAGKMPLKADDFANIIFDTTGTYTINVYIKDITGNASDLVIVTVKVTVYDDVDEQFNWAIDAAGFTTTIDKVKNEAGLIEQAKVKVTDLATGTDITKTDAEVLVSPTSLGEGLGQDVQFTVRRRSNKEMSELAKSVKGNVYTLIDGDHGIIVNNIVESVDNVNTAAKINAAAGGQIYNVKTNTIDPTLSFEHKIGTDVVTSLKAGVNQQVIFTVVGKPTLTKTINANVYDTMHDGLGIIAEDFTAIPSEVQTSAQIAGKAKASVYEAATGVKRPSVAFTTTPNKLGKGANQEVTIEYDANLKTKVNASVFDKISGNEAISAKSEFTIALPEMNKDKLKEYSNVEAWDISNPAEAVQIPLASIDVVDPTTLPTEAGDVTFKFKTTTAGQAEITSVGHVVSTSIKLIADEFLVMDVQTAKDSSDTSLLLAMRASATLNGAPLTPFIDAEEVLKITSVTKAQEEPITIVVKAEEFKGQDKGDKTSKEIKVYIVDKFDQTTKVGIKANSFVAGLTQENAEDFKTEANVKAWDFSTLPNVKPTPIHRDNIQVTQGLEGEKKGTLGARPVTFRATGVQGSGTAIVTGTIVSSKSGNYALDAKAEITISKSVVSPQTVKDGAGVKAWDITDPNDIKPINDDQIIITNLPLPTEETTGFEVIFGIKDQAVTTKTKLNVVNSLIEVTQDKAIVITLDEAKTADSTFLVGKANMSANLGSETIIPVASSDELKKLTKLVAAQNTPIKITFTATATNDDTLPIELDVYVVDNFDTDSKIGIKANDFVIALQDVNLANFRTEADVKAWDFTDIANGNVTEISRNSITIEKGLDKKLGAREVQFKAETNSGNNTVKVTGTVFTKLDGDYAIDAKSEITIAKTVVTADEVLRLAEVKAWNISDPSNVTAIADDQREIKGILPTSVGDHTVVFGIKNQPITTNTAMKIVNSLVTLTNDRNIVIKLEDAQNTSSTDLVARAHATANLGAESITPFVTTADLAKITSVFSAQEGAIAINFNATALNGDEAVPSSVNVYIVDDYDTTTNIAINANDFAIELAQVNDKNLKNKAEVKAWDMSPLPENGPRKILDSNIFVTDGGTKELGEREVEFTARTTDQEKPITVTGYVFTKITGTVALDVDAEFTIASKEVSVEKVRELSHVKAWDISDLKDVTQLDEEDIAITPNPLPNTVAKHTVTFAIDGTTDTSIMNVTDTNIVMNADANIVLTVAQAQAANGDDLIGYAHASATLEGNGVNLVANAQQVAAINAVTEARVAPLDLVINATAVTGDDATQKTVKVYIFDEIDETHMIAMKANNFVLESSTITDIEKDMKTAANVKAWDISVLPNAAPAAIDPDAITISEGKENKLGQRDVVFKAGLTGGRFKTITVLGNIVDSYNPSTKEAINAHNFEIALSELSNENFKLKAEAHAYDLSDLSVNPAPEVTLSVVKPTTMPTQAGPITVRFETVAGTYKEVTATVVKTNITITADAKVAITLEEAQEMDEQGFINKVNASSVHNQGLPVDLKADQDVIDQLNDLTQSPITEFKITLTSTVTTGPEPRDTAEKEVTVYVFDEIGGEYAIRANGFYAKETEVQSTANIVAKANAKVYKTADNKLVPIQKDIIKTYIDGEEVTKLGLGENQHVMFYSAAYGVDITKTVHIYDDVDPLTGLALKANNFVASVEDVKTEVQVLAEGQAQVYDAATGDVRADLDASTTNYPLPVGQDQDVVYTYGSSLSTSKKANIFEEYNPTNEETMDAYDFMIELDKVSEKNIIDGAKAKAYDVSEQPIITPIVDGVSVDKNITPLPTTLGKHAIKFITEKGTTKTVFAYVVNENDPEKKVAFEGHDFVIELDDLDLPAAITESDFKAFDTSVVPGANPVNITSEATTKKAIPTTVGTHTITFVVRGAEYEVTAYVTNKREGNIAFSGHDFVINLADVNRENVIAKSDFEALNVANVPAQAATDVTDTATFKKALPTTVGTHVITFVVEGHEYPVTAYVMNEHKPNSSVAFEGIDFVIELDQVNETNVKSKSEVKAWNVEAVPGGAPTAITDITITKLPTTVGTHPIEFTAGDETFEVTAYVVDQVVGDVAFSGHDFAIALDDVSETNVKLGSDIKAWDISGLPETAPTVIEDISITTLPTTVGDHTIEFTAAGETYEVTAYVTTVFNKETNIALTAHDFNIQLEDVSELEFRNLSGVDAWDMSDVAENGPQPIATTLETDLPEVIGDHDVIFKATVGEKTETIKVTAHVFTKIDGNLALNVQDFVAKVADVKDQAGIIASSEVDVIDITTYTSVGTANVVTDPTKLAVGQNQDVEFTVTGTALQETVIGDIYDDYDPITKTAIDAHNFTAQLADVQDSDAIVEHAQAVVYDTITKQPIIAEMVATPDALELGVNEITIRSGNLRIDLVVGTVFNKLDPTNMESMNAYDFPIALKDISDDAFKKLSGVSAFDVSDPNNIGELDLSEISIKSELPTRVGEHKVIFTTVKGTEIEVMVTVYSKGTTKPNVDAIFANDFVIPFKDLSKEEMMALAGVVAYDETVNPGLQLPASAIEMTTSLPNTLGYYDITFILASGTSVTVTAEVTGVVIFEANDIEMTMEEFNAYKASGTLQEEIIKRSGAKAIIEETGTEVGPINVLVEGIEAVKAGGLYKVNLNYSVELLQSPKARMLRNDDQKKVYSFNSTINMKITEEIDNPDGGTPPPSGPQLPATGVQDYHLVPLGSSLILLGIVGILPLLKRKKEHEIH